MTSRARNWIAVLLIVAVVAAVVGWTWWRAPARGVDHVQSHVPFVPAPAIDFVPGGVEELWRADAPMSTGPFTVDGLALAATGNGVSALNPATGEEFWSYHRDADLCAAMVSQGRVVTVFRGPAGCGEVTSLDAADGSYAATRRGLAPDDVEPVRSNNRAGIRHADMVELWRDDLVRTIEYGTVEASPEPNLQPHPGCSVVDAMTRVDLLAVVNDCPDGHRLVLQDVTPDESRSPELHADVELPGPARLVAIATERAAVLMDGEIVVYDIEGRRGPTYSPDTFVPEQAAGDELPPPPEPPVEPGPEEAGPEDPGAATPGPAPEPAPEPLPLPDVVPDDRDGTMPAPIIGDLPHHMTWFTGSELILMNPDDLSVHFTVPGALGPGIGVAGRILVPVEDGILVVDWSDGSHGHVIPVDRSGSPDGPVTLSVAGATLVEKRGDQLVGLRPLR